MIAPTAAEPDVIATSPPTVKSVWLQESAVVMLLMTISEILAVLDFRVSDPPIAPKPFRYTPETVPVGWVSSPVISSEPEILNGITVLSRVAKLAKVTFEIGPSSGRMDRLPSEIRLSKLMAESLKAFEVVLSSTTPDTFRGAPIMTKFDKLPTPALMVSADAFAIPLRLMLDSAEPLFAVWTVKVVLMRSPAPLIVMLDPLPRLLVIETVPAAVRFPM